MSIVGFNFTRISAERRNAVVGTINIKNNITLKNVSEAKLGLGGDRGVLRVSFSFGSNYTPDLATLLLEGDVLVLLDTKRQAGVLEGWNASRTMPKEIAEPVMNTILERCNIQALLLAKDLNLPSPVPLPKAQFTAPQAAPEAKKADAKSDAKADGPKTTKVKKK